jgi:hypothetical protein
LLPTIFSFAKALLNQDSLPKSAAMTILSFFSVFTNSLQQINAIHVPSSTSKNLKLSKFPFKIQRLLLETKTSLSCPIFIIFSLSFNKNWNSCGVCGSGLHEFYFQIWFVIIAVSLGMGLCLLLGLMTKMHYQDNALFAVVTVLYRFTVTPQEVCYVPFPSFSSSG